MECSTKAIEAMAEIMVQEMQQVGLGGKDIRTVETGMRELLRTVGAKALEQYLEQQDEAEQGEAVVCQCGEEMEYQFKREAMILSVFGEVRYRRRYHRCAACQVGRSALDSRLGIAAGQVSRAGWQNSWHWQEWKWPLKKRRASWNVFCCFG